jgi:hypothetical protein
MEHAGFTLTPIDVNPSAVQLLGSRILMTDKDKVKRGKTERGKTAAHIFA